MAPHTVHVVGSVNDDLRLTVIEHAVPGQTITATSARRELGGKGANQAVAARRAGAAVRFVGAVGTDPAGDELVAALEAEGIDTSGVARIEHELTGRAIVSVDSSGENLITVVPGANGAIDVDAVRASFEEVREGTSSCCSSRCPSRSPRPPPVPAMSAEPWWCSTRRRPTRAC